MLRITLPEEPDAERQHSRINEGHSGLAELFDQTALTHLGKCSAGNHGDTDSYTRRDSNTHGRG
jgi:hypothetical protein